MNRTRKILLALLAIVIGLYPVLYFIGGPAFGLMQSKSAELLRDHTWRAAFYVHISFGGLALLVGWTQFSRRLRQQYVKVHRRIGWVYLLSVWLSAAAGIYIAFFAQAGWVASLGFLLLGFIWFGSTAGAYVQIFNNRVVEHETLMVYSYAACFAAVMLRLWLPLLIMAFGSFDPAYRLVAWLCWVPNMAVAWWVVRRGPKPALT